MGRTSRQCPGGHIGPLRRWSRAPQAGTVALNRSPAEGEPRQATARGAACPCDHGSDAQPADDRHAARHSRRGRTLRSMTIKSNRRLALKPMRTPYEHLMKPTALLCLNGRRVVVGFHPLRRAIYVANALSPIAGPTEHPAAALALRAGLSLGGSRSMTAGLEPERGPASEKRGRYRISHKSRDDSLIGIRHVGNKIQHLAQHGAAFHREVIVPVTGRPHWLRDLRSSR